MSSPPPAVSPHIYIEDNNLVVGSELQGQPSLVASSIMNSPTLQAGVEELFPELYQAAHRYASDPVSVDLQTGNLFVPASLQNSPSLLVPHVLSSPSLFDNVSTELRDAVLKYSAGDTAAFLQLTAGAESLAPELLRNVTADVLEMRGVEAPGYGRKPCVSMSISGVTVEAQVHCCRAVLTAAGGEEETVLMSIEVVDTMLEDFILGTDVLGRLGAIVDLRAGKLRLLVDGAREIDVNLVMRIN
ncbi:hypothetical protein TeGR_g5912 [Tetraparma gracilis]|uniref:Uncharacterized protein n=1 Tax=Tetraparma gracilis TaxID=2962635 RepID=A0ABQ6MV24_9STRA|nr:hypothetical protein TeGR_g5912 [Tetraparma gracilis]